MSETIRQRICRIVFGTDTRAGKLFDVILLWLILASVVVVLLESVPSIYKHFPNAFFALELFFTGLFTMEYLVRVMTYEKPLKYITSSWGIIDLIGILPFYLSLMVVGYHYFVVFRLLRMVRVFRILRLLRFIKESEQLFRALRGSVYKIVVFISFVLTLVVMLGTVMYVVEGPENGFTSIPQSIYWTIVTITTVGYGDITPKTGLGKMIASVVMLCGYAIIAVPTGIVTAEMTRQHGNSEVCKNCQSQNFPDSNYCSSCGNPLKENAV
jgi:voltage-gated potassium channel